MDATELAYAGAAQQARLIAAGEVSAREVVGAVLRRIERLDPHLNAFRVVLPERALAEADQADGRRRAGEERPLLGVPVAIKDDTDVAGVPTARGTAASDLTPRPADAEAVRRLRAAGAVIVGKTNVPELMMWPWSEGVSFGGARNPWALARTPGGAGGGWVERRVGRGGRRRPVRRRARHGRRRLDPDPGRVLRRVRDQAAARPRPARPRHERRLARDEPRRPARADGRGRGAVPRRGRRRRAHGRRLRGGGGGGAGAPADRGLDEGAPRRRRPRRRPAARGGRGDGGAPALARPRGRR